MAANLTWIELAQRMSDVTEFEITHTEGGLETKLKVDCATRIAFTSGGITVNYDAGRLRENREEYLAWLAESSAKYVEHVERQMNGKYQEAFQEGEITRDVTRYLQFVPEHAQGTVMSLVRVICAPIAWTQFKSLKRLFEGRVNNYGLDVFQSMVMSTLARRGVEILDADRASPAGPSNDCNAALEVCLENAQSIQIAYQRMASTAARRYENSKEFFHLLYPASPLK
jgi:hypothetical protein